MTFKTKNESINNLEKKFNDIKIPELSKIGLDFPYYKNISPKNILEFSYDGALTSNDFKIINNF